MALLIAWVSLGACGLLSAVCFVLYLDGKGQRRTIAALETQVAGLYRDLATLSGNVDDIFEFPRRDSRPSLVTTRHAVLPMPPPSSPFEIAVDERLTVEVPIVPAPPSDDDEPEVHSARCRVFIGMTLPFPPVPAETEAEAAHSADRAWIDEPTG